MIKKLTLATVALLLALGLSAQTFTGGVRGTVVSRADRSPVPGAVLVLYQGTAEVATVTSGDDGRFLIEDLDNGIYDLVIQAPDYLETRVNVTVNDGYVKNMFNLSLTRGAVVSEVDVDNLVELATARRSCSARTTCSTTWRATTSVPSVTACAATPPSRRTCTWPASR